MKNNNDYSYIKIMSSIFNSSKNPIYQKLLASEVKEIIKLSKKIKNASSPEIEDEENWLYQRDDAQEDKWFGVHTIDIEEETKDEVDDADFATKSNDMSDDEDYLIESTNYPIVDLENYDDSTAIIIAAIDELILHGKIKSMEINESNLKNKIISYLYDINGLDNVDLSSINWKIVLSHFRRMKKYIR